MRRYLLGDAFHHQHDAAFARRIVHVAGPWDDLMNTAHANNLTGSATDFFADAAALELANRLARAEELARKIHVEDELQSPSVILSIGESFCRPALLTRIS